MAPLQAESLDIRPTLSLVMTANEAPTPQQPTGMDQGGHTWTVIHSGAQGQLPHLDNGHNNNCTYLLGWL